MASLACCGAVGSNSCDQGCVNFTASNDPNVCLCGHSIIRHSSGKFIPFFNVLQLLFFCLFVLCLTLTMCIFCCLNNFASFCFFWLSSHNLFPSSPHKLFPTAAQTAGDVLFVFVNAFSVYLFCAWLQRCAYSFLFEYFWAFPELIAASTASFSSSQGNALYVL